MLLKTTSLENGKMQSFKHEKIRTSSLPPREFCNDERAKLCLFDTQANTLKAHQLYLTAKADYEVIISRLPQDKQTIILEPSFKSDIAVMLRAVAAKLSEAASWHPSADVLLNQKVKPLAEKLAISLNTPTHLSKKACLREDLTDEIVAVAANSVTFGAYNLYSQLTK